VQRAVHDGDMDSDVAGSDRYRLGSREICLGAAADGVESLPASLRDLLVRSDNLYRRIARLDDILFRNPIPAAPGVHAHINRLEQAFCGE
jgi:regulator of CtrA degradation